MRNLMFLFFGILNFSFFISCGEENFDPYTNKDYDKAKGLLPVEIVQTTPNGSITTVLEYDLEDRITSIHTSSSIIGSDPVSQTITYNPNGTVNTVVSRYAGLSTTYTYEYIPSENEILEHQTMNGWPGPTRILDFDRKGNLTTITNPNGTTISFKYDGNRNLIEKDGAHYLYDNTKGFMSAIKTPHWLFYALDDDFITVGTYNLANNVTLDKDNNTYEYPEAGLNSSQYSTQVLINGGTGKIDIKYELGTQFEN